MLKLLRPIRRYFSQALDEQSMLKRRSFFYKNETETTNIYKQDTIEYAFNLKLHPGSQYQGLTQIQFNNNNQMNQDKNQDKDLFLDFQGHKINQLWLNSQKLLPEELWKNGRITITKNLLIPGRNTIFISYMNNYDKDGSGCVSFIDIDTKQYLYTQFEPYMANRVFPVFDQPDLKAKMTLSISCPKQWGEVLSNQHQNTENTSKYVVIQKGVCQIATKILKQYTESIPSRYNSVNFQKTSLISTYLYCFVVGPYKKLTFQNPHRGIPMNLYCIQSLYPYLIKLAPYIEEVTNKSMKFFEEYFGYSYPFNKYDQVFAHEYKWGAMENAGIVTLNDLYIFKDPVSKQKMLDFGNTIVHELAHHWFGNLVTMKWWDDLWLNESFAEYISHFCLEKIKSQISTLDYQSAMASFLKRKNWGYSEDQLITTHPIRSNVSNTDIAESIFDGITYSKGAATMKQFMYLMGEDNFSKALKYYFHKYQFKNAQLDDLLNCFAKFYPHQDRITVEEWKKIWLEKEGLNILSAQLNGQILRIKQTNYHEHHDTLRPHAIKVAVMKNQKQFSQFEIYVEPKSETIIKLSEKQIDYFHDWKAILLNHEDLTFAKIILDKKSISFFQNNLKNIQNILLRSMVWKIFYDMVKDGNLKSINYIEILVQNTFEQTSDSLLQQNLSYSLIAIQKYTPYKHRTKPLALLFNKCYHQLKTKKDSLSQNRKIILRDKIISFADPSDQQHLKKLLLLFNGQDSSIFAGQPSNFTEGWRIVIKILSSELFKNEFKNNLLKQMIQKDNSDTMKNKKITCEVLLCEDKQLDILFKSYLSDDHWSMVSFSHSIAGFNNHIHKRSIRNKFMHSYMDTIKTILEKIVIDKGPLKNSQLLQIFIDGMDPNIQDDENDLDWKISKFQQIKTSKDKLKISLAKKVDTLRKRKLAYKLY